MKKYIYGRSDVQWLDQRWGTAGQLSWIIFLVFLLTCCRNMGKTSCPWRTWLCPPVIWGWYYRAIFFAGITLLRLLQCSDPRSLNNLAHLLYPAYRSLESHKPGCDLCPAMDKIQGWGQNELSPSHPSPSLVIHLSGEQKHCKRQ